MAKSKAQESNIKEKCNKCGSMNFAIDQRTQFRHCQGKKQGISCGNVWNEKSLDALMYQQSLERISELEEENQELANECANLRKQLDGDTEKNVSQNDSKSADEVFQ